jgi:hypothetical protein
MMKYEAQKEMEQYRASCGTNIEEFVKSHERRLDTAYKKLIKLVDDMFADMNKQMQMIANAYIAEKEKKEKEAKIKLTPITEFLSRVAEYKEELESDDYIPALIELLNDPPKQPKSDPLSEIQNYGNVEIS